MWVISKPGAMSDDDGPYKMEPHNPGKRTKGPGSSWLICRHCGLVYLGNDISRLCVKLGCDYRKHPSYWKWRGRR